MQLFLSTYQLLDALRRRPAMYIGCHSPTHLHSFLSGYWMAQNAFLQNKQEHQEKETPDFHLFHDWIAQKLGYKESTSGWAYMIEDQRKDKAEALWLFFELLDEFRGIKHENIAKIEYSNEFSINTHYYHNLKKVRGTFKKLPKPAPSWLAIQKLNIQASFYQLVAYDYTSKILALWNADTVDTSLKYAQDFFGIPPEKWIY